MAAAAVQDVLEFQRLVTLLGEFVTFQTISSDSRVAQKTRNASRPANDVKSTRSLAT